MDRETERKIKAALGMDEVMAALNKLVEDATVGGKKEKAEEEPPEEKPERSFSDMLYEARDEMLEKKKREAVGGLARDVYIMYEGFRDAGFTNEQAFTLTFTMLQSFNKKALK